MSERTAPALAALDSLLPVLRELSDSQRDQLVAEGESLRRAVAAFHMEGIRFRMYAVDRLLKAAGDPGDTRALFDRLRHSLEDAGFYTRSHSAPDK